jgi:adenylylsulfate kinase
MNKPENLTWQNTKITYEDRSKLLKQKGIVLWFTGLSSSGKSTIAVELEKRLFKMGKATYLLDGDNIRLGINSDLGFSMEDRKENIRRVAEIAALMKDAGLITIVAFISPLQIFRDYARERIGDKNFYEIYIKADIETCKKRDPKGLYKKADAGEIKNFTGINSVYEIPKNPDMIVDTESMDIKECIDALLNKLAIK